MRRAFEGVDEYRLQAVRSATDRFKNPATGKPTTEILTRKPCRDCVNKLANFLTWIMRIRFSAWMSTAFIETTGIFT